MGKYDKDTHEPNKTEKPEKEPQQDRISHEPNNTEKPEKEPQQDRRSHGEDVSEEGTHRRGSMGGNESKKW